MRLLPQAWGFGRLRARLLGGSGVDRSIEEGAFSRRSGTRSSDVSEERGTAGSPSTVSTDLARAPLNNRESDVLRLLVQGLANKEIASRLNVSESVIKNTIQQLFAKTEVRTRSQLVRVALECYRELL